MCQIPNRPIAHCGLCGLAMLTVSLLVGEPLAAPPAAPPGMQWVRNEAFSDEFNDHQLDSSKWYDHHPRWRGRPPAKFMPDTISVAEGLLRIRNRVLQPPDGRFRIAGGAVVSKSTEAHYGYYEVRMKASGISMSSTFWFSNPADPSDPLRTSQELDVQEAIGGGKRHPDRKHFMKSNTHYWVTEDGRRSSNAVPGEARISPPVNEAFHVYGVWWVDARTMKFYHNDQYRFTIQPDTTFDPTPFDRPMHMNLVTETYNWEDPPTVRELNNDSINTTYYDWARAYVLVSETPANSP